MAGGLISLHAKTAWPGLHAIWGLAMAQYPTQYTDLVDVKESQKAIEMDYQLVGGGLAQIKTQGGPVTYVGEIGGNTQNYVHAGYSRGYIVSHEEFMDNLYEEVSRRRMEENSFAVNQTIENVVANLYNRAFNASYTYADGQSMCSASHPLITGGTASNILSPAADLSEAAVEDLTIQMMTATNDSGLLARILPMSLHVAPSEWYNANRIYKSVLQADTTSNNINVLKATNVFPKGIKINQFFTSPHAWFIRTNQPNGMNFFWRERPSLRNENDFDTMNHKVSCYMRFSCGMTDFRGVYGSNGP